jgi:riboflavin kinase/FMN adenylyltransferase
MIHYPDFPESRTSVDIKGLAIGFFDGLHRGHRQVIEGATSVRGAANACVLTFQNHPQSVLYPSRAPKLLTGLSHKLRVLRNLGLGHVVTLPFTLETAKEPAEIFLAKLADHFPGVQTLSVGPNFHFGHNRSGDIHTLASWCASQRIGFHVAPPVTFEGEIISSSRIRSAIAGGALDNAAAMLGRPVTLLGTVTQGDGLGRTLGVPTANLETDDQCLPPNGVYAGHALLDARTRLPAAINIGLRPTLTGDQTPPKPRIEAHILEFEGTLYGCKIELEIKSRIRGEKKFPSKDALADAIRADVVRVAELQQDSSQ